MLLQQCRNIHILTYQIHVLRESTNLAMLLSCMADHLKQPRAKSTAINVKKKEEHNSDNYSYSAKGNKFKSFQV